MKNIAVLVSGGGTNLQSLIDFMQAGELAGGRINVVLSSSADAYALTRAKNAGIDTCVIEPKNYALRDEFSRAVADELCSRGTDLVVLAGFLYILSDYFIKKFENRIINVHPSLIPAFSGEGYYGLRVHDAALKRGVKLTGATVHFVNEETDGGPIILQKAVEVLEGDTPQTLQQRVMQTVEQKILPEAVRLFCEGKIKVENSKVVFVR